MLIPLYSDNLDKTGCYEGESAFMAIVLTVIIIVLIVALVGTIFAAKDIEEDYSNKTKGNVMRLTSIYAIVIVISCIAVGVYIAVR